MTRPRNRPVTSGARPRTASSLGRRALHVTGRAVAQVTVFAVTYLAVVAYALTSAVHVDADLAALLAAGGAAAALTFGWALADGRRAVPGSRPVRLWATASLVAALVVHAHATATWLLLAGAMGGSVPGISPGRLLSTGVLTVAVSVGCGSAVAAAGVRTGQARWPR